MQFLATPSPFISSKNLKVQTLKTEMWHFDHYPLNSFFLNLMTLAINNTVLAELCAHFHLTASFLTVPVSAEPIGIIDSLQFLQTSMNTFHRFDSNPFEDTSFVDQLTRQPEKTVVISGFSTEIGVMFTALGALRRDYRYRCSWKSLNKDGKCGHKLSYFRRGPDSSSSDFSTPVGKKVLSCIGRIKH